jgi:hypothetical protein
LVVFKIQDNGFNGNSRLRGRDVNPFQVIPFYINGFAFTLYEYVEFLKEDVQTIEVKRWKGKRSPFT